jgi:hypothetical protein
MTTYQYEPSVTTELSHMLGLAMASLGRTEPATLIEDLRGTDFHYRVGDLDVQTRTRFDRGEHFHGVDITFRTTEPGMIARRSYAPLMLYAWLERGLATYGYLVDVYALARAMELGRIPAFDERTAESNGDGTAFKTVTAAELYTARALLGNGTRYHWTPQPAVERFRRSLPGQMAQDFDE